MSRVMSTSEKIEYFLPEELKVNPKFNIRMDGASDSISDDELKEDLRVNGQLEPCRARRLDDGSVELYFGHRRLKGISLLNMESEDGEDPMKVACIVDEASDAEALIAAASENLKRRDMNALEQAYLCKTLRAEFGWKGAKNTIQLAKAIGKSPAWINGREKLLTLPKEAQDRIKDGVMSADAALALTDVVPDKVVEVIENATEAQVNEPARKGKSGGAGKKGQVKAKHVVAAAKKLEAMDPNRKKRLTMGEFTDWLSGYRNSIPHLYAPVQEFVIYMLDKFIPGQGSTKTADKLFETLIQPACKGVKIAPEVDEKEAAKEAKAAKLKLDKETKANKLAESKAIQAQKQADKVKKLAEAKAVKIAKQEQARKARLGVKKSPVKKPVRPISSKSGRTVSEAK